MILAPGATVWFDVEAVILERNISENSIFTGKVVGDALENKKIVLKEQRKEKQFEGL